MKPIVYNYGSYTVDLYWSDYILNTIANTHSKERIFYKSISILIDYHAQYSTVYHNYNGITVTISLQLWGQKIFPRNVSDTYPSRDKYYYMEGIEGVRLPGGELREPYNWTTEELLSDFEEFLGDAFKIAHILDGSPY